MSLLNIEDDGPSLREFPQAAGFDVSGEEDLFVLDDRTIASRKETQVLVQQVNDWVDEQGTETKLEKRLQAAFITATEHGKTTMFEGVANALRGKPPTDIVEYLKRQDPVVLFQHIGHLIAVYNDTIQQLSTVERYLKPYVKDEMSSQLRRTVVELLKARALHSLAYDMVIRRLLERIKHGIPEWDFENGCEKSLADDDDIPTMEDSRKVAQEAQEEDDKVFARLLSGLFD